MGSSIEKMHRDLAAKFQHVRGRLIAHKQIVGTTVDRALTAVEGGIGGGLAASVDWYMGDQSQAIPEAMVGPVPVVAAAALAGTAIAILMQKEAWSAHIAGVSNGLGAAAAYGETLRFLRSHEAAAGAGAPAAGVHT